MCPPSPPPHSMNRIKDILQLCFEIEWAIIRCYPTRLKRITVLLYGCQTTTIIENPYGYKNTKILIKFNALSIISWALTFDFASLPKRSCSKSSLETLSMRQLLIVPPIRALYV